MKLDNDLLIDVLTIDLKNNIVPFLAGEPGIGKSSVLRQLTTSLGAESFVVPCNLLVDKGDLLGARLVKTDDGSYAQQFFPHYKVKAAVEAAKADPNKIILLVLEEINRSNSDITSGVLTMVTERELGMEQLPPNLKLVATGNTKGNITSLDDASLSRFSIYHLEPDAHTVISHLDDKIHPCIKAVLTKHPETVFARSTPNALAIDSEDDNEELTTYGSDVFDTTEEMLQLTTPRTIEYANDWINDVSDETLHKLIHTQSERQGRTVTLLQELLEGKLGDTTFTKHLIDEIINTAQTTAGASSSTPAKPTKPMSFDALKKVSTLDAMNDIITSLDNTEKSALIIYSLASSEDNHHLLAQLAAATSTIEPEHRGQLAMLAGSHQLNDANVQALLNTNAAVSQELQTMLSYLVGS